ncbi:MAG: hypothetical protein HW413_1408 [Thermoleophilia bacterium]|nr:hypothetical protein [Thermoleophilia bacterium]
MPTREILPRFWRDWVRLSSEAQEAFLAAADKFVDDLATGRGFRSGLRVKGVRGTPGAYELTWAPDGRATFSYGRSIVGDEPHVIWRRIGTHEILREP